MSKKDFTELKCDNCGETISIESGTGFPYAKGWAYLYNFSCKLPSLDEGVSQNQVKDKHFCCTPCLMDFVRKMLFGKEAIEI